MPVETAVEDRVAVPGAEREVPGGGRFGRRCTRGTHGRCCPGQRITRPVWGAAAPASLSRGARRRARPVRSSSTVPRPPCDSGRRGRQVSPCQAFQGRGGRGGKQRRARHLSRSRLTACPMRGASFRGVLTRRRGWSPRHGRTSTPGPAVGGWLNMGSESLEAAIRRAGSPVELLRQSTARPHAFPVAPEFTNWRTEQHAWRTSCVLFDQSHHMTDLFLSGPDALKLLSELRRQLVRELRAGQGQAVRRGQRRRAVHRRRHPLPPGRRAVRRGGPPDGRQLAPVQRGDGRLPGHGRAGRQLRRPAARHAAEALPLRAAGADRGGDRGEANRRAAARREVLPHDRLPIAGHRVRALRHGMAGQPGFELFGPWAEGARYSARS